MNTPNRHMRYRRSVYRKRRIKIIAISAAVAAVVLSLLFVIVGNMLAGKTDGGEEDSGNGTSGAPTDDRTPLRDVRAYPVPLSADGSTLSGRLSSATRNGYSDVCFYMDTDSGALWYVSDVAKKLGRQTDAGSELRTLSNIVGLFDSNSVYSIGITHIHDMRNDDGLLRAASSGFYAAQIAEALLAGVDDVLILAGDLPAERYGELISLADEIHRLSGKGNVGLALPVSLISSSENAALVEELYSAFDYLAADLSVSDGETDEAERINASISSDLHYYVLRYSMRVLIPNTDDGATAEAINSVLDNRNIKNVQIMP